MSAFTWFLCLRNRIWSQEGSIHVCGDWWLKDFFWAGGLSVCLPEHRFWACIESLYDNPSKSPPARHFDLPKVHAASSSDNYYSAPVEHDGCENVLWTGYQSFCTVHPAHSHPLLVSPSHLIWKHRVPFAAEMHKGSVYLWCKVFHARTRQLEQMT